MEARLSVRGILAYVVGIAALMHATVVATSVVALFPDTGTFPPARFARGADLLIPDFALAVVFPYCPARGGDLLFAAAQGSPDRALDFGTLTRFVGGIGRMTATRLPMRFLSVEANANANGLYKSDTRPPFSGPPDMVYPSAVLVNYARAAALIVAGASLPLAAVLLLLLLPGSFRRAHVLRTHLLRAAVYALSVVPVALIIFWMVVAIEVFTLDAMFRRSSLATIAANVGGTVLTWGIPLFSLIWLHAVCRFYLRLPRAWGISVLLNTVLVLAVFVWLNWKPW